MATIALPSIQALFLEFRFQGTTLATGTGFVVKAGDRPFLLTCRHNVTGRHQETDRPLSKTCGIPDEVLVYHNATQGPPAWTWLPEPLFTNGLPRWHEHPTLGCRADFVALPLTRLANVQTYPINLSSDESDLRVGPADAVSVVGFPFGMKAGGYFGLWATGFIASELDYDQNGLPVFYVDCRTREGQSGAPVVAYRGGGVVPVQAGGVALAENGTMKFLGIYSGRLSAQSDMGIVWKASAIRELLAIV